MPSHKDRVNSIVEQLTAEMIDFLSHLIRIPSEPGKELNALQYVYTKFSKIKGLDIQQIPLSNAIKDDPDYSSPVLDIDYQGRYNICGIYKGTPSRGAGKKLLLNAHIDAVPASEGMPEPYSGKIEKGIIMGRGACDDKGAIAAIYMLLRVVELLKLQPDGDLGVNIVVEEENGGNGSLAQIRHGEQADGCIVLEPTEGKILTSIRGAVWFKIEFFGKAGHSGQQDGTISALSMAREAMNALEVYHKDLLAKSRNIQFFDAYENPMPLTFGRLESGNWPAAAPNKAVLEGVLGFLPNKTKEQVCDEFKEVLLSKCKSINDSNMKLEFTYRHDCSVTGPSGDLPLKLLNACEKVGTRSKFDGMCASCDAWFYNNQSQPSHKSVNLVLQLGLL